MKCLPQIALIIFLTFYQFLVFAQNKENKSIDSLEQKILHHPLQDVNRLKMLIDLSDLYTKVNPNLGIEQADKAIQLAYKLNQPSEIGQAFHSKAKNLEKLGQLNEAITVYETAAKAFEAAGDFKKAFKALTSAASLYSKLFEINKAIRTLNIALSMAEKHNQKNEMADIHLTIGFYHLLDANYSAALDNYQAALENSIAAQKKETTAWCYVRLGDLYNNLFDFKAAEKYHQKAQEIFGSIHDENGLAFSKNNLANIYMSLDRLEDAIKGYQEALEINTKRNNKYLIAANLGNLGIAWMKKRDFKKSYELFQKSDDINLEIGEVRNLADTYLARFEWFTEVPDNELRELGFDPSLRNQLALQNLEKFGKYINESHDMTNYLNYIGYKGQYFEKTGDYSTALNQFKYYIHIKDSLVNDDLKRKMGNMELRYKYNRETDSLKFRQTLIQKELEGRSRELLIQKQQLALQEREKDLQRLELLKEKVEKQKKEKELELSNKEKQIQNSQIEALNSQAALQTSEIKSKNLQRNLFVVGMGLTFLLAVSIFVGYKRTHKSRLQSEALLLNILPAEVAEELKIKGQSEARLYENVTVLFTDFVGFTTVAEKLSPTELVLEIHKNFTAFDGIIEKHGLEKIKTIGDAYLAVCGLPISAEDHAEKVISAALDIQKFMHYNYGHFQIRIGINSGPVVAGIVGVKKYAYDIWGDTVNTAARMEQNSEAGKINISGTTYQLIKDKFKCVHRGKIAAKNKGEIDMYFVEGSLNS